MPLTTKRRKISDLNAADTNALLRRLEEFRSSLDEGDEDLPAGLIGKLEELRDKLVDVKHTSFSKADALTLVSMNISSGPLFLIDDKEHEIEHLGQRESEGCLSMDTTRSLILLVRRHVSTVTAEAGCRILINMVLLRVASVMSFADTSVNIIPEFPIPRMTFTTQDSGNLSFSGIVDFLVTRLPSRYSMYLLKDPTTALANPQSIKGPLISNIFEAKRENVRAALPQAVIAAAAYCRHRSISVVRGCVTSGEEWIFFLYETTGDGRGAVRSSPEFNLGPQLEGLALVVGILEDWINNATQSTLQFFSLE